jgi:hypothetical protein
LCVTQIGVLWLQRVSFGRIKHKYFFTVCRKAVH